MKYLISDLYSEYECIGGECPETCCGGWDIVVDDNSYKKYNILDEPEKSWILERISKHDGYYKMVLEADTGRCRFLDNEGWCLLYRNISPDMLCNTCKFFPRKLHVYYDLYVLTASIACPVVAKNIVNMKEKSQFRYMEDDQKISIINPNWERYNEAINGFVNTVDILQDRRLSIGTRLIIALEVASIIQTSVDCNNYNGLRAKLEAYFDSERRLNIAKKYEIKENMTPNIDVFINHLFDIIHAGAKKVALLNRIYRPHISNAGEFYEIKTQFAINERNDIEYENISVQLIFEEYMKVIDGANIYDQFLKIAIYILLLMTQEMYMFKEGELKEENRIVLISRLSRMMDHSNIFDIFKEDILSGNPKERIYDLLLIIN